MAGLAKEIWLPEIMEGFYPDSSFLTEARDLTAFVENDKLNLAEAGVNPDVLVNNTTYPVPMSERADIPHEIELDYYDTTNTVIRNAVKSELSYDKRASVLYGHRQALMTYFMQKAIHAYAPTTDGEFTPVLETTGTAGNDGFKAVTFDDFDTLENRFDEAEIPVEGRIIVLCLKHQMQLKAEDRKLYKEVMRDKQLGTFKVYKLAEKRMPLFDFFTGEKKAYGAAAEPNTTQMVSVAFHKDEVMRCDGSLDLFFRERDPEQRGDILGFQKRGIALPLRGKALGALVSVK